MSIQQGEYGESLQQASLPAVGDPSKIGPKWQYAVARILAVLGGLFVFLALPRASAVLFVLGAAALGLGALLTLARVLAFPPKGTPFALRVLGLWMNPWVLAVERRYFVLPAVILAIVIYITGQSAPLRLLALIAVVLCALVGYLGNPHAIVDQLIARRRTGNGSPKSEWPIAESDRWKKVDLRDPPEGFPALPSGKILRIMQNVRTKSYAVLVDGVGERPSSWSRWSQDGAQWETPIGTADVEVYETWDGRPEAIITMTLPNMMIVIEGVAGKETALDNARLLTDNLRPRQANGGQSGAASPKKGITLDAAIGYAWIPAMVAWVVGVLFIASLDTLRYVGGGQLMRVLVLAAFLAPLYSAVMHTIGIVAPRLFRFTHGELRKRAHGVYWTMLLPSLWNTLVAHWGFEFHPAQGLITWVPVILCGYALLTLFMIRSPEKARRG